MNIGIDVFGCDHGRSGFGSYVLSLVKNLPLDKGCTYDLFGAEIDRYTFDPGDGRVSYSAVQIPDSVTAEQMWHLFAAERFAAKQKYNAVLFPAGSRIVRYTRKTPGVAVVHDILNEQTSSFSGKTWISKLFIQSLKKAEKIIAPSRYIRKNLVNLGFAQEKIEVIYNGIDHSMFYPRPAIASDTLSIQPFAIKKPYIIYASRLSKSEKKHIELIRAFSLFKKKTGLPHRLVLAGSEDDYAESVHKEAALSEYACDIFITGYFPYKDFPELYSASEACIFPSVAEGVGLPVIEAMASGVPVACAKAGSLPEIAGDCALYFDSDDIEQMSSAIEAIITDEKLRAKLLKSGFEWVKRFSWEKTAEKTVELLMSLAF
ncbi:MAG: glycosyltransferase family 4 protein [Treponema lecithinolyticum]|uniref:glycosyltransferase family 4 protein n=1 Tax=Treponema lecithinolyticum TaxID=53418 RepID=UPI00360CB6DF